MVHRPIDRNGSAAKVAKHATHEGMKSLFQLWRDDLGPVLGTKHHVVIVLRVGGHSPAPFGDQDNTTRPPFGRGSLLHAGRGFARSPRRPRGTPGYGRAPCGR